MDFVDSPSQITIMGSNWLEKRKELDQHFLPQILLAGGDKEGTIPILQGKPIPNQTTIQVCKNETCMLPTSDVNQALQQLQSRSKQEVLD